jgi:AmiR/NasT family two-component response regulator
MPPQGKKASHSSGNDWEIALEAGCSGYISKPIKREALFKMH